MTLHLPCLQAAVAARASPAALRDVGSFSPHGKSSLLDPRSRVQAWLKWCYEMDFRACFCLLDEKAALEVQIKVGKAASWISACCGVGAQLLHICHHSQGPNPPTRGAGGEQCQPNPTQPNLKPHLSRFQNTTLSLT